MRVTSKSDHAIVYTPLDRTIIHFGSPQGAQWSTVTEGAPAADTDDVE